MQNSKPKKLGTSGVACATPAVPTLTVTWGFAHRARGFAPLESKGCGEEGGVEGENINFNVTTCSEAFGLLAVLATKTVPFGFSNSFLL